MVSQFYLIMIRKKNELTQIYTESFVHESRKMRWTWFGLRPRLHIGHFLRVLMTFRMHGSQNRWPHIVDRISFIVNISKQMGHFVIPMRFPFDLSGEIWTWAGGLSMPRLVLRVLENELSGVSHRSIVAMVLSCGRFSVTNMTSSSSSRIIGRTVATEFESSINTMLSVMH